MGMAESIDRLVGAPVLVFGSPPPGGRDLDLLARPDEERVLAEWLAGQGFLAGACFARPRVPLRRRRVAAGPGLGAGRVAVRAGPDASSCSRAGLASGSPGGPSAARAADHVLRARRGGKELPGRGAARDPRAARVGDDDAVGPAGVAE